jgi:hypothetical protein
MRSRSIPTVIGLGVLLVSGCMGTTTVDVEAASSGTAPSADPAGQRVARARSKPEPQRAPHAAAKPAATPASPGLTAEAEFTPEQIQLRETIADLELELDLTAKVAADLGEDFEEAMESLEAEIEDYSLQLKIVSGCPEDAETTQECAALGTPA